MSTVVGDIQEQQQEQAMSTTTATETTNGETYEVTEEPSASSIRREEEGWNFDQEQPLSPPAPIPTTTGDEGVIHNTNNENNGNHSPSLREKEIHFAKAKAVEKVGDMLTFGAYGVVAGVREVAVALKEEKEKCNSQSGATDVDGDDGQPHQLTMKHAAYVAANAWTEGGIDIAETIYEKKKKEWKEKHPDHQPTKENTDHDDDDQQQQQDEEENDEIDDNIEVSACGCNEMILSSSSAFC
jgi:hypothetical protein